MISQLTWKVGGEQGEGIDSTGDVLATVLNRLGYHIYGYRHFSSRIKGGHTNFKVRISTRPVHAPVQDVQILIAFGQETIDLNAHEVVAGGVILADATFKATTENTAARLLTIPLTQIAQEFGTAIMKNVVALGATAYLMGLPLEAFHNYIQEKFGRKGEDVVRANLESFKRGYAFAKENLPDVTAFQMEPGDNKERLLVIGNETTALGAMAAGCRVMAAYPITPASDIMEWCIKHFPKVGGVVIQTEDEIAAIATAIGAGFAGARALTASSGPGISLKQENLGLAATAEIPLVIVDVQRAGPSTGMPTKQEQSDIFALLYGTHGETPRIVLAPATAEDTFYDTAAAFNLAEKYQCPVIVATDLQLGLAKVTVEAFDLNKVTIDRGQIVTADDLADVKAGEFKRYQVTESGISPRSIPGIPHGQYLATGVEHMETGKVSENTKNRVAQMQKRWRKLENFNDFPGVRYVGPADADTLFVAFGGPYGACLEAAEQLNAKGQRVGVLNVRRFSPFPDEEIRSHLEQVDRAYVVENNFTGQLANLILWKVGFREKIRSILKYDGTPFTPAEVVEQLQEAVR